MSRLCVNRRLIVWLAARRQGSFALLPFDFHLDDARFAGSQTAIKDSRGKCRSPRAADITREMTRPRGGRVPVSPILGTRLVDGENVDAKVPKDKLRTRVRSQLRTVQGRGLRVDLDWTRKDCGHGYARGLDMATDWTRTDRGCGHESGTCPDSFTIFPRLFRGHRILSC